MDELVIISTSNESKPVKMIFEVDKVKGDISSNGFTKEGFMRMIDRVLSQKSTYVNTNPYISNGHVVGDSIKKLFVACNDKKEYDSIYINEQTLINKSNNLPQLGLLMKENNLTEDEVIEMIRWHLNK